MYKQPNRSRNNKHNIMKLKLDQIHKPNNEYEVCVYISSIAYCRIANRVYRVYSLMLTIHVTTELVCIVLYCQTMSNAKLYNVASLLM